MDYNQTFIDSIYSVTKAVEPLKDDKFIEKCVDILCGAATPIRLEGVNDLSRISNGPGLYCFWVNLDDWHKRVQSSWDELLHYFTDEWSLPTDEVEYSPRANKGNMIKLLKNYEKHEWIPLYIGKSQKVRFRVTQHIELEPHKKTYALKLEARQEQLRGAQIEVASLPLNCKKDDYYLVGLVEYLLRNRMLPIVGKQ